MDSNPITVDQGAREVLGVLKANGGEMSSRRLQRSSELPLQTYLAVLRDLDARGLVRIGPIVRLTAEGRAYA